MSLLAKSKILWNWITVEPVQFLYCLMFTTCFIVRDNLFIEKVCVLDFHHSEAWGFLNIKLISDIFSFEKINLKILTFKKPLIKLSSRKRV